MSSTSIKEALLNRRMLICIFTGFASGMPYYLISPGACLACAQKALV